MDDLIEVVSRLQHEEVSNASEMFHSFVICRDSHICIVLPFPAPNSLPQPKLLLFSICTSAVPTKDRKRRARQPTVYSREIRFRLPLLLVCLSDINTEAPIPLITHHPVDKTNPSTTSFPNSFLHYFLAVSKIHHALSNGLQPDRIYH